MYYLIYFSRATRIMQEEDLHLLLEQSRAWNTEHNLTGMLVYMRGAGTSADTGRFMQVLEGPQNEIDYLFDHIKSDERHHRVTLIKYEPLAKRSFTEWQMGFQSVDVGPNKVLDGFFELDDILMESNDFKKSNLALNFLRSFYTTVKNLNQ